MSSRQRSWTDPMHIVGWVFADLLLGLAIVFLATQPGDPSAGQAPTTTTTTTTTTEPPPSTTTLPVGVDRQYVCFRVVADAGPLVGGPSAARDAQVVSLEQQVRAKLDQFQIAARPVGIVLSFGTHENPGGGRQVAQAFNELVLPRITDAFGLSASRAFWDGGPRADAPVGSIAVNLYPITGGSLPPLPPAVDC